MIQGHVFGLHALLNVTIRVSEQQSIEIEFVVDTGFVGFLTLPIDAVNILQLPFVRRLIANLADGSSVQTDVHAISIVWDGIETEVEVLATGKQPLLGTLMLRKHNLSVDFINDGIVTISQLQ